MAGPRSAHVALRALALVAALLSACESTPVTYGAPPNDRPQRAPAGLFRCTERIAVPTIENVVATAWSSDSTTLAVEWYGIVPSKRTVTGYEEETIIDTLDLRTGEVRPLGVGERPAWSGSGSFASYWSPDGEELRVVRAGRVEARLEPTIPEVRWAGDALLYMQKDEIRSWRDGAVRVVARLAKEFEPRYPKDDVYFSADAELFSLARYAADGAVERYVGVTRSGVLGPLELAGATYLEWAPTGHQLLVRYHDRLELRDVDSATKPASFASLGGSVHGWTPDGRALLVGRLSPTVPAGDIFDSFVVWGATEIEDAATLPNLLGARSFSPNGEFFTGVSRDGLHGTRLEVYRCGGAGRSGERASSDQLARSRLERIQADPRRFVRPAAGAITQYLQGSHTGIDVAAPFGSVVVAADAGTVAKVDSTAAGGRHVCVQHAGGLESCYYHISAALVSVGDRLARGQPLALIGMTGVTTGPHVHWEAKLFGRIVDPLSQ